MRKAKLKSQEIENNIFLSSQRTQFRKPRNVTKPNPDKPKVRNPTVPSQLKLQNQTNNIIAKMIDYKNQRDRQTERESSPEI